MFSTNTFISISQKRVDEGKCQIVSLDNAINYMYV